MTSPDIRLVFLCLLQLWVQKAQSEIHNIEQIDRGYEDIDIRLNKLGARIKRIS